MRHTLAIIPGSKFAAPLSLLLPKMPENPPTDAELEKALEDLFYAANQCAIYHAWFLWVLPVLRSCPEFADRQLDLFIGNGVLEANLLFVRKSAEFFKPRESSDKNDTVYSYRYKGYTSQEWIIPLTSYIELHKRVGHVTIRQARYGRAEWPIFNLVMRAMKKWADFFDALSKIPSAANPTRSQRCASYSSALATVIARMEADAQNQQAD